MTDILTRLDVEADACRDNRHISRAEHYEAAAQEIRRLRARVAELESALGWIADPSHDLGQEDTATFFRDMALRALRAAGNKDEVRK